MSALKTECVIGKFLNSLIWKDAKNAQKQHKYIKNIFFGIFVVF